jgi:hypothetical protein
MNVRFWGQCGHRGFTASCLFLTQSGHGELHHERTFTTPFGVLFEDMMPSLGWRRFVSIYCGRGAMVFPSLKWNVRLAF